MSRQGMLSNVLGMTKEFLELNEVENCLIAPVVPFANIHNRKGRLTNTKKIVVVPVMSDEIGNTIGTITEREGNSLSRIIRSHHFNQPVYEGILRVSIVKLAY